MKFYLLSLVGSAALGALLLLAATLLLAVQLTESRRLVLRRPAVSVPVQRAGLVATGQFPAPPAALCPD